MGNRALSIAEYYRLPAVRDRIREFCGGGAERPLSCVTLSAIGDSEDSGRCWELAHHYPPDSLNSLLDAGYDVARSLWDKDSLLLYLDIDYQNVDFAGEPYAHPADTFLKLEPTYQAARQVLRQFQIPSLAIMTGRGYHFVDRIPIDAPQVDQLAGLVAEDPAWLATFAARRLTWMPASLDARRARAHTGLGMLVEYLGHQIMRIAGPKSPIPVMFNGTVVGPGIIGRECTSIDLSSAGDPFDIRHVRVAFGAYQNHRLRPDLVGEHIATAVPPFIVLPRGNETLFSMLEAGRGPDRAAQLSRRRSVSLPIATHGVTRLLEDYRRSPLARFHRDYYAIQPHPPTAWPDTYDQFDARTLPNCAAISLLHPNDLLLQPTYLQHVTRMLMARGWHPRHIAGLIHSRYAQDHGWGSRWTRIDPSTRADFDVRVFAGMLATGLDQVIDFNCKSAQDKGLCPRMPCTFDLRRDRERLLALMAS